jgi:hypothetical protein
MVVWSVTQLECIPFSGQRQNVVCTIHWRAAYAEGDYTASCCGTVSVDEDENFTPFEELTEEIVVGWVQERLGTSVAQVEAGITAEVATKANPPIVRPRLPWA